MIRIEERTKIELLAPAKNLEFGMTAINYGADAVYIGAAAFGARAAAGNPIEDIQKLCDYAHQFDAKVYATLNTILYDKEIEQARRIAIELYDIGIDAIIIQDLAFLDMELPDSLPLFASTQTNNYNLERIKFLDKCGFSRIILARELSLEQIQNVRKNTSAELEFFIHGAICVSLSGQCYISSYSTNRSGNRGECSQVCRHRFNLLSEDRKYLKRNKFLLSPKDLNLSEYIPQLIAAGITSFKIEGRLKDISYIKNVVAYYRNIIDNILSENNKLTKSSKGNTIVQFTPNLEYSFNRGFTSYFIDDRKDKIINELTPKSIGEKIGKVLDSRNNQLKIENMNKIAVGDGLFYTSNKNSDGFYVNKIVDKFIIPNKLIEIPIGTMIYRNYNHNFEKMLEKDKSERKIDISINIKQINNSTIEITADDSYNSSVSITIKIENSTNDLVPKLINQLSKTGGTIYNVIDIKAVGEIFGTIQIAKLNEVRRILLNDLTNKRIANRKKIASRKMTEQPKYPIGTLDYSANISNSISEEFYKKSFSEIKEKAFELLSDRNGKVLMTTKHCLKFDLDDCPKYNDNAKNQHNIMYLEDKSNKYKVTFDCKHCFMIIESIE